MYIYIITIISFFACYNNIEPLPCPPICNEDNISYPLEINWKAYFHKDSTTVFGHSDPIIYQDKIITTAINYTIDGFYYLYLFDINTGEKIKDIKLGRNSPKNLTIIDNYLIITTFDGLRVYDILTYQLVKFVDEIFSFDFSVYDNSVFVRADFEDIPYSDSSSIFKLHIPSLELEKIFTIKKEEYSGFCSLNPVSLETNTMGDTMIYGTMETSPFLLYCYNMSVDTFVWQTSVVGYDKFYSKPLLDDNNVYITQDFGAEAYDKQTGKRVWRKELEGHGGYRPCQPLLIDEKLFIKETNDHLYCLNTDGIIMWHNSVNGGGSGTMEYYDNKLYFTNSGVFKIIDANNGKLLFKAESPYDKIDLDNLEESKGDYGVFNSITPAIDAEKGVFYLSDSKRMFCFGLWRK